MNIYVLLIKNTYFKPAKYIHKNMFKPLYSPPEILVPAELSGVLSKDIAATFMRDFWYCEKPFTIKQKYIYISKIFTNPFIDDQVRKDYILQLCQIQKQYFTLMRFVRMCNMKKAKVQIRSDLCMDELSPHNPRTFILFQNGRLYYFSLNDLAKILINSVCHSSYLFSLPIRAKNPYNNMEFNKADLYNMYFRIKTSFMVIPRVIDLFFRHNFDIYSLKKHHESELFHYIVDNYLKNSDEDLLLLDYDNMLKYTRMRDKIIVSCEYPINRLLTTMRPFIRLFLLAKYICDNQLKYNYECELVYRLRVFYKFNPLFGRKLVRTHSRCRMFHFENFAENCGMKFVEENKIYPHQITANFMNSHIYTEYNYNSYVFRGYYDEYTNMDNFGLVDRNGGYQPVLDNTASFSLNRYDGYVVEDETNNNRHGDDDDNDRVEYSFSITSEQISLLGGRTPSTENILHEENEDEDTIIIQDSDSETSDHTAIDDHPIEETEEIRYSDTDNDSEENEDPEEDYDW